MASACDMYLAAVGGTRAACRRSPTGSNRESKSKSTTAAARRFFSGHVSTSTLRGRQVSDLFRRRTVTPRAASLPPNKEWPPSDVWSEFRATHAGTWVGWSKRFAPNGESKMNDADADSQWTRTSAASEFAGPGGIDAIDTLVIETKYVSLDDGKNSKNGEPESKFTSSLLPGGQIGKMCVATGDFISGPVVLPDCVDGMVVTFESCFVKRVEEDNEDNYGSDDLLPWDERMENNELPTERVRIKIEVEANPTSKRNWRAAGFEVFVERKEGLTGDIGDDLKDKEGIETEVNSQPRSTRLGEDDIATGEWRSREGATFLTCESLLDDAAYAEFWLEKLRGDDDSTGQGDESNSSSRARVGKKKGRGRVVIKTDTGVTKTGTVSQSEQDEKDLEEKEELEKKRLLSLPKPDPEGLVVVPTWAVAAKAPFTSAHEYVVGGNSPLALLPGRLWVLVESVNDELLIECGVYCGDGGLGESGYELAENGDVEVNTDHRRAVARRYERGGRFASAFFVEERVMSKAELEDELEPGEGDKPLTF